MAEAFFNRMAAGRAVAVSAGTRPAAHMDSNVVGAVREVGLDISHQRARQIQASDLDAYDLIFAMDEQNYCDVLKLASNKDQRRKVHRADAPMTL